MDIKTSLIQFDSENLKNKLKEHLEKQPTLCKYCGNPEIIKIGKRRNREDLKQRYHCDKCKKSFTDELTRYGNQELWIHEKILDLAVQGVKPNAIKDLLNKKFKNLGKSKSITKPTVLNIIKKDCQFLSTFEYNLCHTNFSKVWEIDDTYDSLINNKKCYVFNVKAVDTKYWLVSYASLKRNQTAQRIALTYAFNRANYAPGLIRTDGFAPKLDDGSIPQLEHCKIKSISKKHNYSCINNVERTNLSMREVIQKGSCSYTIEHIQSLVELKRIHYNFLQKHESFGYLTPAKIVGFDIPIDNWTDLFRIADYFDRTNEIKFL